MLNMQNKAAGAVGPAVGRRAVAAAKARATIGPENENIDDSETTQFSVKARRTRQLETDWIGFFSLQPGCQSSSFLSVARIFQIDRGAKN